MAGTAHEPRTVLEFLIRQRNRTYEELSSDFDALARSLKEDATLSPRHLRRLAAGERSGTTPVTRRVLQAMFSKPIEELLRSWDAATIDSSTGLAIAHGSKETEQELITMAAQRARQFALLTGQDGLTGEAMELVYEDVRQLTLDYPQRPLGGLLGNLVTTQENVYGLLERRVAPAQARQLYLLAGVTGGLLAKASHDLGDPQAAMTQARTAYMCAEQADHPGLRAWIRGLQSLVAYWAGRPHESIRYAQSGGEAAALSRNTTSVWLPVSEARAWATVGNAAKAREAIQRAEAAWDSVQPDDLDELGGLATFGRSRQLYYAAESMAWLPAEADAAQDYSARAVSAYADPSHPDWAFGDQAGSHASLAIARVHAGELEGAVEAIAPVLDLAPEKRNNGIMACVLRVHKTLASSPLAIAGQDLQEQIEMFARIPLKALPR
ncbi:hypothetical protein [Kitasatospora purpeofusca]|uniref:hypothetical protein n=1 Tax=Kitasatospora purpeofusca TaxID=67352 RepID=UPI0004C23043|nr:hypothetical protein [Kitasatospora purpeofusca]